MFSMFVAIALQLLPIGASVVHTDSGTCAQANTAPVQACTGTGDTVVITIAGNTLSGQSRALKNLIENI